MALGIGQRIKERRIELGLTQLELAQRMGYKSKAAICKVEKGDDNITTDRVKKFAKALEVTESYLMGWFDEPNFPAIRALEDRKNNGDIEAQAILDALNPQFTERMAAEEYQLLRAYRDATAEEKRMLLEMVAFFRSKRNN